MPCWTSDRGSASSAGRAAVSPSSTAAAQGTRAARQPRATCSPGACRGSTASILTHFDADHCNGVRQLLRRVQVDTLYIPELAPKQPPAHADPARRGGGRTSIRYVTQDLVLPQEGGSLTIFAPTGEKDEENAGLCVLAACEKYDILITGDLTAQAEYRLLSLHTLPQAAVLVAGHHGAATSTSKRCCACRPAGGRLHFRRGGQPLRPSRRADARAHPAVRRGRVPHRPVRHDHHQGVRTWQERHLTRTPGSARRFQERP